MVLKDSRFTGGQLLTSAFVLSLAGIIPGFFLWKRANPNVRPDVQRVMQLLGIVVLFAMIGSLIGWWFAGLFFIVLALLLLLAIMRLGTS